MFEFISEGEIEEDIPQEEYCQRGGCMNEAEFEVRIRVKGSKDLESEFYILLCSECKEMFKKHLQ